MTADESIARKLAATEAERDQLSRDVQSMTSELDAARLDFGHLQMRDDALGIECDTLKAQLARLEAVVNAAKRLRLNLVADEEIELQEALDALDASDSK